MSATYDEARFIFDQWHDRIQRRDWAALAELYADDATLESPLVRQVVNTPTGVVSGRIDLDRVLAEITDRRPDDDELPSLYRTGEFLFNGHTLMWEYPRRTPTGEDQLDLVEVMELDGPRIRNHRVYWGWRGAEHIIDDAVDKAVANTRGSQGKQRQVGEPVR